MMEMKGRKRKGWRYAPLINKTSSLRPPEAESAHLVLDSLVPRCTASTPFEGKRDNTVHDEDPIGSWPA